MLKSIYNLEFLVSVHIRDKKYTYYFGRAKERKANYWLLRSARPAGFKNLMGEYISTKRMKEIMEEHNWCFDEDGDVCEKPYARLEFTNGKNYKKEFDTVDEALKYGEDIARTNIKVQLVVE